jgi:small subunit ribosomal protein S17
MANNRRRLIGRVTSNKMEKTVVVTIDMRKTHPIYGKVVSSTKKIMAHDESNAIALGAVVRVVESKPLSRKKRWVVEEVLAAKNVDAVGTLPDETEVTGGAAPETASAEAGAGEGEA